METKQNFRIVLQMMEYSDISQVRGVSLCCRISLIHGVPECPVQTGREGRENQEKPYSHLKAIGGALRKVHTYGFLI
ncbi:hypothetical protein TNCV_1506151 [Trichonephila clavipes]|nr:hypothetical protein TNCV_1506151 [Trichonephila clavipes]